MRQDTLDLAIADLETVPKIKIHNKNYTQVVSRVEVFRRHFPNLTIDTKILDVNSERVLMRAEIRDGDRIVASGHAEEVREASAINRTSAVEVAETSAVGRALAAFGLHGGEYASAGEVQTAIAQQETKPNHGEPHGPLNITKLKEKLREFNRDLAAVSDENEMAGLEADSKALLQQCERDLPGWWYGKNGSDVEGIGERITKRKTDLAQADSMYAGKAAE